MSLLSGMGMRKWNCEFYRVEWEWGSVVLSSGMGMKQLKVLFKLKCTTMCTQLIL